VLVLLFVLLQQNPLRLLLAMALYMLLSPLGQLQALEAVETAAKAASGPGDLVVAESVAYLVELPEALGWV